jgi:multisubunit Na+/H+ antiporter MnhC subunit
MSAAIYLLAIAMLLVGVYAVVAKKNVVKIIVGLLIVHYAMNLLLVLVGYRASGDGPGAAPILARGRQTSGRTRAARGRSAARRRWCSPASSSASA